MNLNKACSIRMHSRNVISNIPVGSNEGFVTCNVNSAVRTEFNIQACRSLKIVSSSVLGRVQHEGRLVVGNEKQLKKPIRPTVSVTLGLPIASI